MNDFQLAIANTNVRARRAEVRMPASVDLRPVTAGWRIIAHGLCLCPCCANPSPGRAGESRGWESDVGLGNVFLCLDWAQRGWTRCRHANIHDRHPDSATARDIRVAIASWKSFMRRTQFEVTIRCIRSDRQ